MTVADLIAQFQELPQDMPVVTRDRYYDGTEFQEPNRIFPGIDVEGIKADGFLDMSGF